MGQSCFGGIEPALTAVNSIYDRIPPTNKSNNISGLWLNEGKVVNYLYTLGCIQCLPADLLRLISRYIVDRPPFSATLPEQISYRYYRKRGNTDDVFMQSLLGATVYLVQRREDGGGDGGDDHHLLNSWSQVISGSIVRSPFIVVWCHRVDNALTYFGLVFPTISFDHRFMSFAFGPPQEEFIPPGDKKCYLVFYDITILRENRRVSHLTDSVSKIQTMGITRHHNKNPAGRCNSTYPVYVVAIQDNLASTPYYALPFYDKPYRTQFVALASHPSWPWNTPS